MQQVYFTIKLQIVILSLIIAKNVCEVNSEKIEPIIQTYKEYFIEHVVSRKDAAIYFKEHKNSLLNDPPPEWCSSNSCDSKVLQYCLGNQMLHDHCCCDARHGKEQLPWLPHSCFFGENCRPFVGSCITYMEWRKCCCDKVIAQQWKHILSLAPNKLVPSTILSISCIGLLLIKSMSSIFNFL